MLFRNPDDKLIEIKKHDFVSDKEYYKTIIKIKKGIGMINRSNVVTIKYFFFIKFA